MADTHEHLLRYKVGDNTSQWQAEPSGDPVYVVTTSPVVFRPAPEFRELPREGKVLPDGEHVPGVRGIQNVEFGNLDFDLEGLSGGGAGDGVDASTLLSTMFPLLAAVLGGSQASTGGVTDASDGGSGTTVNAAAGDGAGFAAGDAMLVKGTTSGSFQAREVVSVATDAITADRTLTDDAGAADTADEDEVLYGARTLYPVNNVSEPLHLWFASEHDNDAREVRGAMPTGMSLNVGAGDILRLILSGIRCTDWLTAIASGAGTYAAPTTGNPIVCAPLILHIGSTRYVAHDFGFDFGINIVQRKGPGPNNVLGFARKGTRGALTCKVSQGVLTAPQELTQALRESIQGASTYSANTVDVSLQIGDQPGATMYIRMPAARGMITADGEEDGLRVADLSFRSSKSANHANAPGGYRVHFL